jgi:hypothetical protein
MTTSPTPETENPNPTARPAPAVYAAIAQASASLAKTGVSKSRRNEQQGYAFRGIDEVLNALNPALVDARLAITVVFRDRHVTERSTKSGQPLFSVTITGGFQINCAADGSFVYVTTIGEAMDTADKATNKAMSAAYKYMALLTFCIPLVGEDADETTHEVAETVTPEPEGYAQWLGVLKVAAVGGTVELREAFKAGTEPQRTHLTATSPEAVNHLKGLALEADAAKAPKVEP